MSAKPLINSTTSTVSARKPMRKIQASSSLPEGTTTGEPLVVSDPSISPLDEALQDFESRLKWDNDVRFHVSRNLLHLRKYRKMSQETLASKAGTSQSAIARIESGD